MTEVQTTALDGAAFYYEQSRSVALVASLPRVRSVAFTGSSSPVSLVQLEIVGRLLRAFAAAADGERVEFHHGDCIEADENAAKAARDAGLWVVGHPPRNPAKRAWVACDELRPADEYVARNGHIVTAGDVLVSTPQQNHEELRSGTWATIRRGRKACLPVIVVGPGRMWLEDPVQSALSWSTG